MIDQKKRTYHFETSSLLPLKLVLIEAEKESHPRVSQEQNDVNEELALKLIASMKKKYRKAVSLRGALVPGTARQGRCATTLAPGASAGEQSPRNQEIASLTTKRFARNDIEVEP